MILASGIFRWLGALRHVLPMIGGLILSSSLGFIPSALPAAEQPAPGMFLIATRDLTGSGFSESVILLIQHDENGTMGLVINQPTDVDLATILPEVNENVFSTVYLGGPVATYGIILLIKSTDPLGDADHVFGNIYASGSRALLLDLLDRADSKNSVRLYAGHAGWFPGQLDYEIRRGSWYVVQATEAMIFEEEPRDIWRKLVPPAEPIIARAEL
jgi:putative transcriptional regulator